MLPAEVELGVVVDVGPGDGLAGDGIVEPPDRAGQRDEVGGQRRVARARRVRLAGAALVDQHRLGDGPARG